MKFFPNQPTLANGDFTYEGATGFVGTDSFEYTLEDGNGSFDTAFASITVTAPAGAVVGTEGDDNISSGSGNNVIFVPGSGNDWLDGGAGINTLTGGSGADTFVLGTLNAQNTLTDFSTGDGDKLHLADLLEGSDPLALCFKRFSANRTKRQQHAYLR